MYFENVKSAVARRSSLPSLPCDVRQVIAAASAPVHLDVTADSAIMQAEVERSGLATIAVDRLHVDDAAAPSESGLESNVVSKPHFAGAGEANDNPAAAVIQAISHPMAEALTTTTRGIVGGHHDLILRALARGPGTVSTDAVALAAHDRVSEAHGLIPFGAIERSLKQDGPQRTRRLGPCWRGEDASGNQQRGTGYIHEWGF